MRKLSPHLLAALLAGAFVVALGAIPALARATASPFDDAPSVTNGVPPGGPGDQDVDVCEAATGQPAPGEE